MLDFLGLLYDQASGFWLEVDLSLRVFCQGVFMSWLMGAQPMILIFIKAEDFFSFWGLG